MKSLEHNIRDVLSRKNEKEYIEEMNNSFIKNVKKIYGNDLSEDEFLFLYEGYINCLLEQDSWAEKAKSFIKASPAMLKKAAMYGAATTIRSAPGSFLMDIAHSDKDVVAQRRPGPYNPQGARATQADPYLGGERVIARPKPPAAPAPTPPAEQARKKPFGPEKPIPGSGGGSFAGQPD